MRRASRRSTHAEVLMNKEELELLNGVYPDKPLPVGEYIKVVQ